MDNGSSGRLVNHEEGRGRGSRISRTAAGSSRGGVSASGPAAAASARGRPGAPHPRAGGPRGYEARVRRAAAVPGLGCRDRVALLLRDVGPLAGAAARPDEVRGGRARGAQLGVEVRLARVARGVAVARLALLDAHVKGVVARARVALAVRRGRRRREREDRGERAHRETPGETPGSFQRASEEKLRTRRIVSVADRFRRSATETPPSCPVQEARDKTQ